MILTILETSILKKGRPIVRKRRYVQDRSVVLPQKFFNPSRYSFLHWYVISFRRVEPLAGEDAAKDLFSKQSFLLLDLLQDTFVFRRAPAQVRQHLHYRTVRYVFIRRITALT